MKPFELPETTQVVCTNVNQRTELHGDERVKALDLSFMLTGPNTLLDLIEPGLREEYFHNAARKKGQKALLADEPLPNLRRPHVKNDDIAWDKGAKSRGYRFQWDHGIEDAKIDLTDVVMYGIKFDCLEGGTVNVYFGVQYNGEELRNSETFTDLCDLPILRAVHIRLLAPPELLKVSRGYRAGKPDTPDEKRKDPNQQELPGADEGSEGGPDAGSPEAAFIATGGPAVH